MSVLLRTLAWIGDATIGDHRGPGWVHTVEDGPRTIVHLTDEGRALLDTLCGEAPQGGLAGTQWA